MSNVDALQARLHSVMRGGGAGPGCQPDTYAMSREVKELASSFRGKPAISPGAPLEPFNTFLQVAPIPELFGGAESGSIPVELKTASIICGLHGTVLEGNENLAAAEFQIIWDQGFYNVNTNGQGNLGWTPFSVFSGMYPWLPLWWPIAEQNSMQIKVRNTGFATVTPKLTFAVVNIGAIK